MSTLIRPRSLPAESEPSAPSEVPDSTPGFVAMPPAPVREALDRMLEQLDVELAAVARPVIALAPVEEASGVSTLAWWLLTQLVFGRVGGEGLYINASATAMPVQERAVARLAPVSHDAVQDLSRRISPSGTPGLSVLNLRETAPGLRQLQALDILPALSLLRERFAWIVLDLPPVLTSPLSAYLAQKSDAAFLVLEAGRTDRRQAQAAADLLRRQKVPLSGVLLNKARG